MLEPAYRNHELLIYKQDIYKECKEDKQPVKKILQYNKVDSQLFYKVQQKGYEETIQELEENLKHSIKKSVSILLEITSGNIKKKRLKLKELAKDN